MSELTENIKVFVRLRPMSSSDIRKFVHVVSDQEIALSSNTYTECKYKFNAIFPEYIHQDEAYNVILVPIVRDIIQGYSCTLFSYGATRADTPNIIANHSNLVSSTPILAPTSVNMSKIPPPPPPPPTVNNDTMNALVSCAMYRLFEHLTQLELSSSVRISYLEILDEELVDLLQPNAAGSGINQLKIFENDKSQVYVNGLTETTVHSAAEALMILRLAQKNARSPKSHSIFTISVQSKEKPKFQVEENEELFKYRKMCLVQLGSQESQKKQARAKTVQSLTSLSRVVQALINKQTYIPYRDSKLTRIMQESLGGNAKTSIVASIASGSSAIEETIQTLEFLNRMNRIVNHPKINERLDDARTLNEMTLEIRKLIMDIDANRNKCGHFLTDEMYVNYQNEMHITRTDTRRYKQELKVVNEQGDDLDCTFSNVNSTLCVKRDELEKLQTIASTKQRHVQILSNVTKQREMKINRHSATEKTITEQAAEITAVVREVLVDKSNLDDSVARYRVADARLIQTVLDFQADMKRKLDGLKEHSTATRTIVDAKLQKTGDLERAFTRNANLLIKVIKTKSLAILDQLEVNLTKETNKWNDNKNDFSDYLVSHLKSSELNHTLYKEFAEKLGEQSNTIELSYKELRELYLNHFITVNKMVDDIKQRMKSHSEKVSGMISAMHSSVGECVDIGSTIDDKMQLIYEQMRTVVVQIQQNASGIKNTIEPNLQATEKNVQQMKMEIVESLDAHLIAVNEQRALFTHPQLSNDFRTKQTELKDIVEKKMVLGNDLLENVAINNTSAIDTSRKYIDTITKSLPSKRDIIEVNSEISILQSDLNGNQSRLSEQYKANAEVLNGISSDTQSMSKKMTHEISACCNQLKYFCEMDFCEYEPLGETPVKRDFDTNISLAATTPLDRIKQRFRDRFSQINGASPGNYSFLSN
ncbi:kinesin-like protein Klp61F [Sitodiplosis mosellana]|uniref:kinesin-like protein Klp61F n=1 Tax=Sitodiplosis mosellana TaxID=263140 RepID=UPI0024446C14|nr:kinesin-like protein Klp61F [Sitodiplosis mosellana]